MYVEDEYDVELIPLAKACEMLDELPEILGKDNRTAALTVDGKPVLAVLPWHVYESVVESLDIMEDPEMVDALRKSMDGIPEEDLIPIDEVTARLGD